MFKRQAPGLSGTDKDRNRIKERWPQMSVSEKLTYIKDYYGVYILGVIVFILAVVFLYRDYQSTHRENAFYVMAVEASHLTSEVVEGMEADLTELFQIDPEKEEVIVENGYGEDSNYQNEATIFTYMQSGRVDLVIIPEEEFNRYAASGYLASLKEEAYKDLLETITEEDRFYATLVDYSEGGPGEEPVFAPHDSGDGTDCYGIYLRKGLFEGRVLGVMINAPHPEKVRLAMDYFLN